jgi:hypothetical protein
VHRYLRGCPGAFDPSGVGGFEVSSFVVTGPENSATDSTDGHTGGQLAQDPEALLSTKGR